LSRDNRPIQARAKRPGVRRVAAALSIPPASTLVQVLAPTPAATAARQGRDRVTDFCCRGTTDQFKACAKRPGVRRVAAAPCIPPPSTPVPLLSPTRAAPAARQGPDRATDRCWRRTTGQFQARAKRPGVRRVAAALSIPPASTPVQVLAPTPAATAARQGRDRVTDFCCRRTTD